MKKIWFLGIIFSGLFLTLTSFGQEKENPWTKEQLKAPSALAAELDLDEAESPVVIDMGPAGVIKGAIEIGPAEYEENIKKLKDTLESIPRDKEVVVYCGCCPFDHCPNVRPAFQTLLDMGFQKPRLLNLSQNLKADWIDKGYPLEEE